MRFSQCMRIGVHIPFAWQVKELWRGNATAVEEIPAKRASCKCPLWLVQTVESATWHKTAGSKARQGMSAPVQPNPKNEHETTTATTGTAERDARRGKVRGSVMRQGRDSRPLQLESSRLSGVAFDCCAAQYPACILLPSRFSCRWRPTNSNSCNNFWLRFISSVPHPLIPACLFSCRYWGCFRDRLPATASKWLALPAGVHATFSRRDR